jgi:hypothetical protein
MTPPGGPDRRFGRSRRCRLRTRAAPTASPLSTVAAWDLRCVVLDPARVKQRTRRRSLSHSCSGQVRRRPSPSAPHRPEAHARSPQTCIQHGPRPCRPPAPAASSNRRPMTAHFVSSFTIQLRQPAVGGRTDQPGGCRGSGARERVDGGRSRRACRSWFLAGRAG